jgi:hypothetical protein
LLLGLFLDLKKVHRINTTKLDYYLRQKFCAERRFKYVHRVLNEQRKPEAKSLNNLKFSSLFDKSGLLFVHDLT